MNEKLTNKKYLWTSPNLLYQFLADYVMDLVYQYSQQAVKLKKASVKGKVHVFRYGCLALVY